MDGYGFFQFTPDGKVIDQNLDSTLIVEGVLFLSAVPCKINIDAILPMRHYYNGGFIMPIPYSTASMSYYLTLSNIYIEDGFIVVPLPSYASTGSFYRNQQCTMAAFSGLRFYYGYFN